MGEANKGAIETTISANERVVLARVLTRIESKGSEDRKKKTLLFSGFKMESIRGRLEDAPERLINSEEVLATFEATLESLPTSADKPRLRAMNAAVQTILRAIDPFQGERSKDQEDADVDPNAMAWLLEKLKETPTTGSEDTVISELEDRFFQAKTFGRSRAKDAPALEAAPLNGTAPQQPHA